MVAGRYPVIISLPETCVAFVSFELCYPGILKHILGCLDTSWSRGRAVDQSRMRQSKANQSRVQQNRVRQNRVRQSRARGTFSLTFFS